ncbi:MAG TPA: Ig-like domain-containing protein, partial [Nitrososphaeraceae archaeon]
MMLVLIWIILSLFLLTSIVVVYAASNETGEGNKLGSSSKMTTANVTGTSKAENKENVNKTANGALELDLYRDLKVYKNGNQTIDKKAVINNPTSLPFTFIVKKYPNHGIVSIKGSLLTYTPEHDYNASDSFTFIAHAINTTTPIESNQQNVTVAVEPKPLFNTTPEYRAVWAFGLSSVVVSLIFYISFLIIKKTGKFRKKYSTKFRDIVRDENWYPSLAIFQFLMWTAIVLFAYFGIALLRFFSGVGPFTDINQNILFVMGISAGTTGAATAISKYRYGMATPIDVAPTKETPSDEARKNLPGYKTMLMENGKITLTRFQMFAWTWIGVIAYLGLLFLVLSTQLGYIEQLSLPTLPAVFPVLMGVSEGVYLGDKLFKQKYVSINEVRPKKIRLKKGDKEGDDTITILGSNFGQELGTVWLEYYPPLPEAPTPTPTPTPIGMPLLVPTPTPTPSQKKSLDEFRYDDPNMKEQFDVTPVQESWKDRRIKVKLDIIVKGKLLDTIGGKKEKPVTYVVRVERDGQLTYANSDATFEIDYEPTPPTTTTP